MPLTRQDCVLTARQRGQHQAQQPKPRRCCPPARQKSKSKTPKEDLGTRGPEPWGEAAPVKSHEFRRAKSECRIDERRRGLPTRPRLCEWRRGRQKKSFSEHFFPRPPAGVDSLGAVCSETDAPHRVKRAGFSQTFGASAQKVLFYGRVL